MLNAGIHPGRREGDLVANAMMRLNWDAGVSWEREGEGEGIEVTSETIL
jgi:hypothetical protein